MDILLPDESVACQTVGAENRPSLVTNGAIGASLIISRFHSEMNQNKLNTFSCSCCEVLRTLRCCSDALLQFSFYLTQVSVISSH